MLRWLRRRSFQCLTCPMYCALVAVDWFGKWRKATRAAGADLAPFRPGLSIIIPERSNPALLAECRKVCGAHAVSSMNHMK